MAGDDQGKFEPLLTACSQPTNLFLSSVTSQMIKGEFIVVEYLGWENSYTEIVPNDRLRPKNTNPPITQTTFYKFEIPVSEELRE